MSRVPASATQKFIARRDLDDAPHVPSRSHRNPQLSYGGIEDQVVALFDTETVELLALVPLAEVHDEIEPLSLTYGGDPEELTNVEDSETPISM